MSGKTGTRTALNRNAVGAAHAVAALFFPARCRICDQVLDGISRVPVCDACWNRIEYFRSGTVCDICGLPGAGLDSAPCETCLQQTPEFSMARSLGEYGGALRDLLHLLKYNGLEPIGARLGEQLAAIAQANERFSRCEAIAAVPLDKSRERERGYNQAERIARTVARRLNLPLLATALRRVRATTTQIGLTREERRENMRDAFSADRALVADRTLLLVDDVMTTGATLDACAQALLKAGAREVLALTVARTPQLDIS